LDLLLQIFFRAMKPEASPLRDLRASVARKFVLLIKKILANQQLFFVPPKTSQRGKDRPGAVRRPIGHPSNGCHARAFFRF
jgi:hypothetical protein